MPTTNDESYTTQYSDGSIHCGECADFFESDVIGEVYWACIKHEKHRMFVCGKCWAKAESLWGVDEAVKYFTKHLQMTVWHWNGRG